jgi:hypothetical protein
VSIDARGQWQSRKKAITIQVKRLPIVDVIYQGPLPCLDEYQDAFFEYTQLARRGKPLLWLIDMQRFDPLSVDATTRKGASEIFYRHRDVLRPVSVAEARVTRDKFTRYILTAFDWLTQGNSDKWPCQQFDSMLEAEGWLLEQYRQKHPHLTAGPPPR